MLSETGNFKFIFIDVIFMLYLNYIFIAILRAILFVLISDLSNYIPSLFFFNFHRVTQIKTYSWDNAQVVLVGNKSDLGGERQVTTERGRALADTLGL